MTKRLDARREWQGNHKLQDDPRITPFDRLMRRTSLDELPQLLGRQRRNRGSAQAFGALLPFGAAPLRLRTFTGPPPVPVRLFIAFLSARSKWHRIGLNRCYGRGSYGLCAAPQ